MNGETLISIYPNTMGFGFVILNEKGEILDYGVVSIHPADNEKCFKRIQEIIVYCQPRIIILEDYQKSNKSPRIEKLIKNIYDVNRGKSKIHMFSKQQIKDTFEIFGAKNKYEISRKIVEVYPQLKTKLPDKRKAWEPENYYQGIFDALSMVLVYQYIKK
jgi:hypothetical protein